MNEIERDGKNLSLCSTTSIYSDLKKFTTASPSITTTPFYRVGTNNNITITLFFNTAGFLPAPSKGGRGRERERERERQRDRERETERPREREIERRGSIFSEKRPLQISVTNKKYQ